MPLKDYRFDGSRTLCLKELPTDAGAFLEQKEALIERTEKNIRKAAALQDKLYAEGREGIVFAIQARDAAGKDSLIRKVFSGLNPQGLSVHSFKSPSKEELAHDYLWRIEKRLPERGSIAVFNRTHYEDVLIARVHHLENTYRMPARCITEDFYEKRYRQLRQWEKYLSENGYRVVKVLLNVSKETEKQRFLERIDLEEKHWKYSAGDVVERADWDAYTEAYEIAINATAKKRSPWYVLPADDKWYTRYLMSEILLKTLKKANPQYPAPDEKSLAVMRDQREMLENE